MAADRASSRPPPPVGVFLPMRWWDVAAVLAVEAASFGVDAWSGDQLLSELAERDTRRYEVLRPPVDPTTPASGGDLLGYLGLSVHGSQAEIQTVAVHPAARGRGLGRALVARALHLARAAGARRVGLEVREDDPVALALYRGAGFTRSGRRPGYYGPRSPGGPRVPALLLDLDLHRDGPHLDPPHEDAPHEDAPHEDAPHEDAPHVDLTAAGPVDG